MMTDFIHVKSRLVLHVVVQQGYGIDWIQLVVPRVALGRLLADGECGIIDRTVLEELLRGVLHLDNKLLAVHALAIDVEDGLALGVYIADVLGVAVFQALDYLAPVKQAIEEIDQQVLVGGSAEYALETEVGQQADVSFFYSIHTTKHIFATKIQFFRERCKKIHRNFADEDLFVAVKQLFLDAKYKKEGIYMPRLLQKTLKATTNISKSFAYLFFFALYLQRK